MTVAHDGGYLSEHLNLSTLVVLVHAPSSEPAGVCSETLCSGPNLKI